MQRMPTIKTLSAIHDADHARMRKILKMTRKELRACAECSDMPAPRETWEYRMRALNKAARTHGVEYLLVSSKNGAKSADYADYLNTGDSYAATIIRWRGQYRVQSVGDFVETMERQGVQFK